jgi:uncharacterized membrane protein
MNEEAAKQRKETDAPEPGEEVASDSTARETGTETQSPNGPDAPVASAEKSPEKPDKESDRGGAPQDGPAWEAEIDVYPLREAGDDAKWAVRTVWIWLGFALIALGFILVLLVLGAMHD